jgi:thiosulfate/3-mercaptopyruvate sulfurtransferase
MFKYIYTLIFIFTTIQFSTAEERLIPFLVSASWLSEHANDPNLVIIHVGRIRQEYNKGHIPGSRFLWFESLSPNNPDETIGLPSLEQAKNILEELGISNSTRIILYSGSKATFMVTRTFLILDYLGVASNASVIDGGLDAWKSLGKPISKEPTLAANRGKIVFKINPQLIVDANWIKANLKNPAIQIVDVRGKITFDGTPNSTERTGHIANAKNIPTTSLLDSLNKFKSVDDIQKLITGAGINTKTKIVSYCGIGFSASVLYLAAKLAGYDNAVYDGSWEDWSEKGDDYPVEITPPSPSEKVPEK